MWPQLLFYKVTVAGGKSEKIIDIGADIP